MQVLYGDTIAKNILDKTRIGIEKESAKPGLAVFLIGEDKPSEIYVNLKRKAAEKIGIEFFLFNFRIY